ncbi:hypothetical protein [Paenibacillus glycanilyticus]|uniref:hypothetical protein n=1 Tax=Paenibacillus glycanilyticus TaxID=126569 RepID=UPI001910C57B|nr:hypothetical protein [Paenibacillus glycanilyticus]
MKRYAITIALVLIIGASLGTYYTLGTDLHLPEYRLQTLEGNPAEAAGLTLTGSYVGGKGSFSFEVSANGSKRFEPLFWKRWQESDGPLSTQPYYSDFHSLYQEHSKFMRGKSDTYGFYKDQNTLIFAKASYVKGHDAQQDGTILWNVDALDLASGKQTRYTDELSEPAVVANVFDVQLIGSEVHVLTYVSRINDKVIDKIYDMKSGKPIRTVQLPIGEPTGPDRELRIELIADVKPTATNPNVLYIVQEQSRISSDNTSNTTMANNLMPVIISEHLYAYHYATEEVKEVPLEADIGENKEVIPSSHYLEGDTFTTIHVMDEAVTINRYDLSRGQFYPKVTVKADQLGKGRISQALIANGRVYVLLQTGDFFENNSMPIAAIADTADGRILYKGTPVIVKSNGRPEDQLDDVWLLNIMVQS